MLSRNFGLTRKNNNFMWPRSGSPQTNSFWWDTSFPTTFPQCTSWWRSIFPKVFTCAPESLFFGSYSRDWHKFYIFFDYFPSFLFCSCLFFTFKITTERFLFLFFPSLKHPSVSITLTCLFWDHIFTNSGINFKNKATSSSFKVKIALK